jgi:hypothetical protein
METVTMLLREQVQCRCFLLLVYPEAPHARFRVSRWDAAKLFQPL